MFRLSLAALLGAMISASALAQTALVTDELWMIDEDQLLIDEVSREFVSQKPMARNGAIVGNRWSGNIQFVAMTRNDDIDILWGAPQQRTTLETDINSGLSVDLNFEPDSTQATFGDVRRLSFLMVRGEGRDDIFGDTYESSASLVSGSLLLGTQSPLLRGQSRSLLGVRYVNVSDEIDRFNSGVLLDDDWISANNHVVTMDGSVEGVWYWNQIVFTSSLSGGVGFNQATQQGWLATGPATHYETSSFNFSTVAQFKSAAGLRVTDQIRMQLGVQGMMVTGVHQVRNSYGRPGDSDTVRLAGLTFGIEQEF